MSIAFAVWAIGFAICMIAIVAAYWNRKETLSHARAQGLFMMAVIWPLMPLFFVFALVMAFLA